MSLKFKAWLKILLGTVLIFALYLYTKTNSLDEILPPTIGYRMLVISATPMLIFAWGVIELITTRPLGDVAEQWETLTGWKKLLYSIAAISVSIIVAFILVPLLIYS